MTTTFDYGPESHRQAGVPQGSITQFAHVSTIFPNARRDYWVYVPQQYASSRPAAVMVF